jgi:hypothetical protein
MLFSKLEKEGKTMANTVPMINQCYQEIATNRTFEVLNVDEYLATINLHYDDGEFEQISLEDWSQMAVQAPSGVYRQAAALATEDRHQMPWVSDVDEVIQSDYLFGWDEF